MGKRIRYREMKKQLREWVEDEAWLIQEEYIKDPLYYSCVKDIFENKAFQSMNRYIQHGSTTTRAHCIQVSYLAYRMALRFHLNFREAARGGLLHDLFLYDWHTHAKETGNRFHGFTHPRAALKNAEKEFQLTDREKNIILRHMWPLTPIPPKYAEGFLVVYADKYCGTAEVLLEWKKKLAMRFKLSQA